MQKKFLLSLIKVDITYIVMKLR